MKVGAAVMAVLCLTASAIDRGGTGAGHARHASKPGPSLVPGFQPSLSVSSLRTATTTHMSVRSNLKMSAAPAVAPPTEAQPRKMLRLRVKEDEEEAGRDDAQAETEAATTVQLTRDPGTATMVLRGILTPTGKTTVIGNANQAPRSGGSGLQAATLEMRSVMLMLALVLLLAMVMLITRTRRWNGCL